MTRRALDLFCGAGGAARGLLAAGFEAVVGVDRDERGAVPYPGEFVVADVFGATARLLLESGAFDFVWASPPCQRWAAPTALTTDPSTHPCRIAETRELLDGLGRPPIWAMENVPRAPLRRDVALTGPLVGLDALYRLRHFELGNWRVEDAPAPRRPAGSIAAGTLVTVSTQGGIPDRRTRARRALLRPDLSSSRFTRDEMREAMGLPEDCAMSVRQVGEAVPPAYAEWIGRRALAWLDAAA